MRASFITDAFVARGTVTFDLHTAEPACVRASLAENPDAGLWFDVSDIPALIVKLTLLYARA